MSFNNGKSPSLYGPKSFYRWKRRRYNPPHVQLTRKTYSRFEKSIDFFNTDNLDMWQLRGSIEGVLSYRKHKLSLEEVPITKRELECLTSMFHCQRWQSGFILEVINKGLLKPNNETFKLKVVDDVRAFCENAEIESYIRQSKLYENKNKKGMAK